jgi:hypothetical protein
MNAKLSTPSRERVEPRAAPKPKKATVGIVKKKSKGKPPRSKRTKPLAGARQGPAQPVNVTRVKRDD